MTAELRRVVDKLLYVATELLCVVDELRHVTAELRHVVDELLRVVAEFGCQTAEFGYVAPEFVSMRRKLKITQPERSHPCLQAVRGFTKNGESFSVSNFKAANGNCSFDASRERSRQSGMPALQFSALNFLFDFSEKC
ncbi:MAG TPA: hypothetical protein PKY59_10100 [Pyrinomonadaceae bacterium]|nr:hypothetical protein [Pyrinomonadaceae bacterium]